MSVKLADAVAYLKTDDAGLRSGLDDAERRTSAWSTVLGGALIGIGLKITDAVAGAVRGAAASLGETIGLASDLGETISKTGQLFGDSADSILAWSDTAAVEFGQTKQQALDAAGTFAIFGKAAGLSGTDLTGFATGLSELASDLASFNNTSPEDAINAIGAALRGEAEPLRAYGVLLDDATLKAAAFDLGLTTSANEALTQQQKIMAAQKVIFDQTQVQQGDFSRTSDGLANQQRILAGQWTDFKTSIGTIFLPVVTEAVGRINNLVQVILPPLKDFLETQVIPAFEAGARALGNVFSEERMLAIGNWIGALVGGMSGASEDTTTYADNLGRSVRETTLGIGTDLATMREDFSTFASWFTSPEAGEPAAWWMRLANFIVEVIGTISQAVAIYTRTMAVLGEGFSAFFSGDWGALGEADEKIKGFLDEQLLRVMERVNRIREMGGADPFDLAPYGKEPVKQYNNFLPIIINASGDPAAIADAAARALQAALRQAGIS